MIKRTQEKIDEELLNIELGLEYDEEFLDIFIPTIKEIVPTSSYSFFRILDDIVEIQPAGYGGISFRDSKNDTSIMVNLFGYDYIVVKDIISLYESKMMQIFSKTKD